MEYSWTDSYGAVLTMNQTMEELTIAIDSFVFDPEERFSCLDFLCRRQLRGALSRGANFTNVCTVLHRWRSRRANLRLGAASWGSRFQCGNMPTNPRGCNRSTSWPAISTCSTSSSRMPGNASCYASSTFSIHPHAVAEGDTHHTETFKIVNG
jgi:hypothetical protein